MAAAPADVANWARFVAELNASFANPTFLTSSSDNDVKIVTAVIFTAGAALTAALIISLPPLA